ncbi:MAG: hypothetical protein WC861_02050 [Candidatus Micrarchaeia archaeon]|jgi:hypothetical protein
MRIFAFPMLACALLLLSALPAVAFADVIEPNTHAIEKCVKITGLNAYPNIALVGEVTAIGSSYTAPQLVQITNNNCISIGNHYKFDPFRVYYVEKSYIDRFGVSGIVTGNISGCSGACTKQGITDKNLFLLGGDAVSAPYAPYYVSDTDSAKSVMMEYMLECQPDADKCMNMAGCGAPISCSLTLANGQGGELPPAPPDDNTNPKPQTPLPAQLDNGQMLQAFWCWLMGLFGQKC